MRAVVTRVKSASVLADGVLSGSIEGGLLVLLGVGPSDNEESCARMADKICGLRIFEDEGGKMNLNLTQAGGSLLVVSQFTLYADTKSRRPGFSKAAPPALADALYEAFKAKCHALGHHVASGVFGAHMELSSVNDGPVTLWLDTDAP